MMNPQNTDILRIIQQCLICNQALPYFTLMLWIIIIVYLYSIQQLSLLLLRTYLVRTQFYPDSCCRAQYIFKYLFYTYTLLISICMIIILICILPFSIMHALHYIHLQLDHNPCIFDILPYSHTYYPYYYLVYESF